MAWKYPPYTMKALAVMATEDFSENCERIIEEVTGELNEHNWQADAFTRADVADAAQFVLSSTFVEDPLSCDPSDYSGVLTFVLPTVATWQVIGGTQKILQTHDCILWITGSVQYSGLYWSADLKTQYLDATPGIILAIRVDGVVITESILGSGEPENEAVRIDRSAGGVGYASYQTYGFGRPAEPLQTEAVVPVATGTHTIELVARPVLGRWRDYMSIRNRDVTIVQLYNTVLE
jgi:hypothetical protein